MTLNPLLSVAHLDAQAKGEAAKLHPGRYVAMISNYVRILFHH